MLPPVARTGRSNGPLSLLWAAFATALVACVGANGTSTGASATAVGESQRATPASTPRRLRVEVIERYPHDPQAFTQGLVLDGQTLYESTGLEGRSTLRRVDLATGRVLDHVAMDKAIFAEGLAVVGQHFVQLTWKNGLAFQYDKKTLKRTRQWPYSREGWGACYDGRDLITSDGTATLAFRDPATLAIRRDQPVRMNGNLVAELNELECVDTSVYANVWMTESLVRIDSKTGAVLDVIDASGLLTPAERAGTDVLNGIAYDAATKTFLITGKLWPRMFRVRFVPS